MRGQQVQEVSAMGDAGRSRGDAESRPDKHLQREQRKAGQRQMPMRAARSPPTFECNTSVSDTDEVHRCKLNLSRPNNRPGTC